MFTDITDYSPAALTAFLTASSDAVAAGSTPSDARKAGIAAADTAHAGEPETAADLRPSDLKLATDYARYVRRRRPLSFTTEN